MLEKNKKKDSRVSYESYGFCKSQESEIYKSEVDIKLFKVLNDALIFNIIDENDDEYGYVIVSPSKDVTIIESAFYEFDENDRKYLKKQAKAFCYALT